jgi:hypothetical protein
MKISFFVKFHNNCLGCSQSNPRRKEGKVMKRKIAMSSSILSISAMLLTLAYCPSNSQVMLRQIAGKRSFTFQINDKDTTLFGIRYFFDSTYFSVNSIARIDDLVILIDPVHNNVKSIDLARGTLGVSQVLLRNPVDPNRIPPCLLDVFVIDSNIYVTSSNGFLFVLDRNLSLINKSEFEFDPSSDQVFFKFDNQVFIYSKLADIVEDSRHWISIKAKWVKDPRTLVSTVVEIKGDMLKFRDIEYGFKKEGKCLWVENNSFCLGTEFPRAQYPLTRQIWISGRSVSFYSIVDKKLVLSVYDFD